MKIRQEEAPRVARALTAKRAKTSKPGKAEDPRVGGFQFPTTESQLLGAQVPGGYLFFVKSRNRAGDWTRSRGVEILDSEREVVASFLTTFAATAGEDK